MARRLWRDRMRRLGMGGRALFRPGAVERDLEEELRLHQELAAAQNPSADARRRAAATFGSADAAREAYRQAGDLYGLQTLLRDLRYGAHLLRRSPLFTVVATLSLALGIGLNVAVFGLLRTVLLRPLPYAHSDQLVTLAATSVKQGTGHNVGWLTVQDWQQQARSFTSIATFFGWSPTLSSGAGGAQPQVLAGVHVSANFFPTLGVSPILGRNFSPEEDRPQRNRVVLLSNGFWRSQFAADPGVIGRTLQLNHQAYQVVGVLPAHFDPEPFRPDAQVWTPNGYDASVPDACRSCQHLRAIGRLAQGVALPVARQEMDGIERRLGAQYPNDLPPDAIVLIQPLRQAVVGDAGVLLWLLLGGAGVVLLIVCANLANLMLARAALRQRELAVRAALGAGRLRLLRQLLTEGALLGLLGGGVGCAVAALALQLLRPWAAEILPRLDELRFDPWVLLFALALSLAAGMLVGLASALQSARTGAAEALRGGRGAIAGSGPRRVLIVAEIGLAVVLAVGAGLVLKSFVRVLAVSPGFNPAGAYSAEVVLSGPGYASDAAQNRFTRQVLARLAAQPGFAAAGVVSVLPLDPGNYDTRGYFTLDPPLTTFAAVARANAFYDTYFVSPGYFAAMGIHLVRGRLFTEDDIVHPTAATIVDESLARKFWPGKNPLGQAIRLGGSTAFTADVWSQVVGVVADVHQYSLDRTATPEVYLPYTLNPGDATTLVVRSQQPPLTVEHNLQQAVWGLDGTVPVVHMRALAQLVALSVGQRRLALELMGALGLLALILAALGIYGVVAYTTAQRTCEIGLRLALGAEAGEIRRLVVAGGLRPVLVGLGLGGLAALALGRVLAGLTFQVSPDDPTTLAAVLALLLVVAVAACWLPARRASRLDPAQALRAE